MLMLIERRYLITAPSRAAVWRQRGGGNGGGGGVRSRVVVVVKRDSDG